MPSAKSRFFSTRAIFLFASTIFFLRVRDFLGRVRDFDYEMILLGHHTLQAVLQLNTRWHHVCMCQCAVSDDSACFIKVSYFTR